jgi:pyrophosphatase PpaX
MAIVTSKLEPSARRSLDFLGLSRHFDLVVGLEATEKHKPDPAPVRYAVEGLGARPDEAAFVGDSPHDVLAGNAAGVATVAALWGPFGREDLAWARPRAWAEAPGEVLGVLKELG